jgi:hypothetical protein
LNSETNKGSHLIKQVRDETEKELTAVKRSLQDISTEFDSKLEQNSRSTNEITDELAGKLIEQIRNKRGGRQTY